MSSAGSTFLAGPDLEVLHFVPGSIPMVSPLENESSISQGNANETLGRQKVSRPWTEATDRNRLDSLRSGSIRSDSAIAIAADGLDAGPLGFRRHLSRHHI